MTRAAIFFGGFTLAIAACLILHGYALGVSMVQDSLRD